nr:MAG TPA: hypothetical protein [Caudoviricetes sp.]
MLSKLSPHKLDYFQLIQLYHMNSLRAFLLTSKTNVHSY